MTERKRHTLRVGMRYESDATQPDWLAPGRQREIVESRWERVKHEGNAQKMWNSLDPSTEQWVLGPDGKRTGASVRPVRIGTLTIGYLYRGDRIEERNGLHVTLRGHVSFLDRTDHARLRVTGKVRETPRSTRRANQPAPPRVDESDGHRHQASSNGYEPVERFSNDRDFPHCLVGKRIDIKGIRGRVKKVEISASGRWYYTVVDSSSGEERKFDSGRRPAFPTG